MGAAPERSNLSFVSPLRESEVRTTTVTAFSNKPGPQRFARILVSTVFDLRVDEAGQAIGKADVASGHDAAPTSEDRVDGKF